MLVKEVTAPSHALVLFYFIFFPLHFNKLFVTIVVKGIAIVLFRYLAFPVTLNMSDSAFGFNRQCIFYFLGS